MAVTVLVRTASCAAQCMALGALRTSNGSRRAPLREARKGVQRGRCTPLASTPLFRGAVPGRLRPADPSRQDSSSQRTPFRVQRSWQSLLCVCKRHVPSAVGACESVWTPARRQAARAAVASIPRVSMSGFRFGHLSGWQSGNDLDTSRRAVIRFLGKGPHVSVRSSA